MTDPIFVSKSVPIRQVIDSVVKKLANYIQDVQEMNDLEVDRSLSKEEKCSYIENGLYIRKNMLTRMNHLILMLENQSNQWSNLQRELNNKDLEQEQIIYGEYCKKDPNFIQLMLDGKETMFNLESQCIELTDVIANLSGIQQNLVSNMTSTGQNNYHKTDNLRIHLPKLHLPIFYGDSLKWIEFWDAFEASVHTQDIPAVQKFNYLISTLKGAAYKAIEGIAVTNATYQDAIEILKNRFGDYKVIKRGLYSQLKHMAKSSSKTNDLRRTLEGIERITRQLKCLHEDLDQPALMMLVLEKLPTDILIKLGEMKPAGKEWTIEFLSKNLNDVISNKEEAYQITNSDNKLPYNSYQNANNFIDKEKRSQNTRGTAEAFVNVAQSESKYDNKESRKFGMRKNEHQNAHTLSCIFCGGNHWNDKCSKYDLAERKHKLVEKKLCFKCLKFGHTAKICSQNVHCVYCKGDHNRALCNKNSQRGNSNSKFECSVYTSEPKIEATEQNVSSAAIVDTEVSCNLLPKDNGKTKLTEVNSVDTIKLLTAVITIINPETKESFEVHAFLDSGSQRSYITNNLKERIKLKSETEEALSVYTFASKAPQQIKSAIVNFDIKLYDGSMKRIRVNTVPHMTETIGQIRLDKMDKEFLRNFKIAYNSREEINVKPDILIGIDNYWDIMENAQTIKLPSGLFLVSSKIGYLISGKSKVKNESPPLKSVSMGVITVINGQMDGDINLEKFWNLESIGINEDPNITENEIALKNFNETIRFDQECKRYEISWPWRGNKAALVDNYGLCFGRLQSVIKRLNCDKNLLEKYANIMKEQLEKGIIEMVKNDSEPSELKHYLPHHPVITPHKTTTKVRIVYDASARIKKSSLSLNDCLYPGPIIMPDLCGILMRFRLNKIAVVADVEKAFLQISINERDRDATRFLWLKDSTKPTIDNNVQIYRFCRVPFGINCSPFILNATLKYHLQTAETKNSLQASNNLYIDNLITGFDDEKDALEFYEEMKQLFSNASMNLREWNSNSSLFKQSISGSDKSNEVTTKVLGIVWNTEDDTLTFELSFKNIEIINITKREALKQLASIFDPLGMLAPLIMQGKFFIQSLWKEKLSWDDLVTEDKEKDWEELVKKWINFNKLTLPRCICLQIGANHKLITFVDASKLAYAAVVYLQTSYCDGSITCNILFSKNRLAPIKEITIPRLELMAAVIGKRATEFVEDQLNIKIDQKYIFSDSKCVLYWIKSTKPLSVFVANRVKELKSVKNTKYFYVQTHDNPADQATRFADLNNFDTNMWLHGPHWLKNAESEWPQTSLNVLGNETLEYGALTDYISETKCNLNNDQNILPVLNLARYSNLGKVKRIMIYILRFMKKFLKEGLRTENNLSRKLNQMNDNGALTLDEYKNAEQLLIKQAQKRFFEENPNDKQRLIMFKQLGVKRDQQYILRCYGRLEKAELDEESKYPILLPPKDPLTKLIILDEHNRLMHFGVSHTLSSIRKRFWIPKGRQIIKKCLKECLICRKYTVGPFQQPAFAQLPKERVKRASAFQYVGLDYFGPLKIKLEENRYQKCWVCVFTCLITRAIHLEYIYDQSASSFLNCLRRFISRRQKPEKIISDNAAQFKLTEKVINKVWPEEISDEIKNYCSEKGIKWIFIPEFAPWEGGFYERLIGSIKQGIKRTIGRKLLTIEDTLTLLAEIEAVINTRPLIYETDELDSQTLRPIDFWNPGAKIGTPQILDDADGPEFLPRNIHSTERLINYWRNSQENLDNFWKIWHETYLTNLRERYRGEHKHPRVYTQEEPEENDVVLIKEENVSRGFWKMGKIINLIKSQDGAIRSVNVQTANQNIIRRPVNLLYPIEISHDENVDENDAANQSQNTSTDVSFNSHGIRVNTKSYNSTVMYKLSLLLIMLLNPVFVGSLPNKKFDKNNIYIKNFPPETKTYINSEI